MDLRAESGRFPGAGLSTLLKGFDSPSVHAFVLFFSMEPLPSQYIAKEHEDDIYKLWEASGAFVPHPPTPPLAKGGIKGGSFSMVMPPPNVTGTLHLGHAVMLALEDIMVRYHRMKGDATVWIPGTDHASIATQTVVEKKLLKEQDKSRHQLGREAFLAEIEKFVQVSKDRIKLQVRKMGASCDWSREAYTLDEPRSVAVRTAFKMLYDKGLLYRGNRIVNWCPRCASTLADDEVEYKAQEGILYFIKYPLTLPSPARGEGEAEELSSPRLSLEGRGPAVGGGEGEFLVVATTRPETKLGDTALAVHPSDARYSHLVGKEFDVDLAGHLIHVKVIADSAIDPKFGSGVVGVTPSHSMTDDELALRHALPHRQVIREDGKMMDAGKYTGLYIKKARVAFVEDLRAAGLLEKEEPMQNNLSVCYRCGTAVEPLPKLQWFMDVNKKFSHVRTGSEVTLKQLMHEAVESGSVTILPDRFKKVYFEWINNLRDWCVSRQIWFGHRIPVWYRQEEVYVGASAPQGEGWEQDPDTLDTWFSSGLWTFSTLGWPSTMAEAKVLGIPQENRMFHPTSVLETGYDIVFFWVARMILMSTALLGEVPFKTVYLHGLVRDMKGKKMSKSVGNVIDPLDMIEKYGADAVRVSLFMGTAAGTDVKLNEQKIAGYRNFANKIWNATRFVLMNLDEEFIKTYGSRNLQVASLSQGAQAKACGYPEDLMLTETDQRILSELHTVVREVTDAIEKFDFNRAGDTAYHYFWHTFCDVIIEDMKPRLEGKDRKAAQYILYTILVSCLKLLHPFMPFVTEALWEHIPRVNKGMLIQEKWPIDIG